MRFLAAAVVVLVAASCSSDDPLRAGPEPAPTTEPAATSLVIVAPTTAPAPGVSSSDASSASAPGSPSGRLTLRRVDPRTLEDIPGVEPIASGEWFVTQLSSNERWLGIIAADDDGRSYAGVFDLARGTMAAPFVDLGAEFTDLWIDDNATLYMIHSAGSEPGLHRLLLGGRETEVVAELSMGFSRRGPARLEPDGSEFVIFGVTTRPSFDRTGSAVLYLVDVENGTQRELDLSFIRAGFETLEDTGAGPVFKTWDPALIWDPGRGFVYIVHADGDRITAINLDDLSVVADEEFNSPESALVSAFSWLIPPAHAKFYDGNRRQGVLSADGARLFVATGAAEAFKQSDGRWANTETPLGIQVIDTDRLQEVDRIDLPVDSIALSPDGSMLFASGTSRAWSEGGTSQIEPHGLFVLDSSDLSQIAHLDFGQSVGPPLFSLDGSIMYVASWSEHTGATTLHAVDLETMQIVGERDNLRGWFVAAGALIADLRPSS